MWDIIIAAILVAAVWYSAGKLAQTLQRAREVAHELRQTKAEALLLAQKVEEYEHQLSAAAPSPEFRADARG